MRRLVHPCLRRAASSVSAGGLLRVSPRVRAALSAGAPVVALESTIIAHGMPWPANLACAREVEAVVRARGAEPATVAVVRGALTVGCEAGDLEARLIGGGPAMKKLVQQVKKLITVRTPVLLTGEAGTGKGVVADILHELSHTPEAPLVRIDCALSSEGNFRAGLLGENGAGGEWVRQAKGGTLFLRNIHHLPLPMQTELVSVLRNNAHGFRLICSTNENLEELADEGKFHDELFYRVASLPVNTPALRERTGDLSLLAKHFASRVANPHFDASLVEFSEDALAVMASYDWPGNLAELNQVVSQIASTADARIVTSEQLPMRLREIKHWPTLTQYLAGQEKQYIERVLHTCKGNKAAAAKVLDIDVSRLG